MKAVKTWVLLFLLFLPAINVHAYPIPDTGQTKCYNNTVEITCPTPGQPFYGQDGNYTINPPSYTKLDATGTALTDDAASWTMIRDNVTGLIWENKTSDGSIHDGSRTFTQCDTNPETNGGGQGICGTGSGDAATNTEAFIKALNDAIFGGFSDWRMPNVKELATIVDLGRHDPAINAAWFSNTASFNYWSSTPYVGYTGYGWCIHFAMGNNVTFYNERSNAFAVRAVRGGQSENRYIDNSDGTVTDTTTGLMWQQETVIGKNWQAALDYTEALTLGGYDDWRLPTLPELKSIVDYNRCNPSIDTALFPGTESYYYYWSSTSNVSFNDRALSVFFSWGYVVVFYSKTYAYAVRAVRGGQNRSSGSLVISSPAQAAWWEIGEQKTILWDTAGISGNVRISLSRQGGKAGTFEVIADSVANNGSYSWTVSGTTSYNSVLKIEPLDDLTKSTTQGLFSLVDTVLPNGSIVINDGVAITNNATVTLTLSASDYSGVTQMQFSNDNTTWSTAEEYATTKSWTLSSGDGSKTVYVKFKDTPGNWSSAYSAGIVLDATVPITTANPPGGNNYYTSQNVVLSASETATIYYTTDGSTPTETSTVYSTPISVPGPASVTLKYFAKDTAGNVEEVKTQTYAFDTTGPAGTITIKSGAASTNSVAVTLTISATDPNGVVQMQFSNDNIDWSDPETYATTKSWNLLSGDGTKTVYVKLKDGAGNWSSAYSDTITLDTVPPTGSIIIADGATYATSSSVNLTLSATDITSGVAQMSFSNDDVTWSNWEAYATSKTWTLANGDGNKTVYARYKDNAGNVSENITGSIILDLTAPTAAVNTLAAYQTTLTFPISWTGNDAASGILNYDVQYRDGASGTWIDWQTAVTVTSATFTGLDGHTYYFRARARDNAGYLGVFAVSDTQTTVDLTPPPLGALTINGGALSSTSTNVIVSISATDAVQMSFSNDGINWSEWQAYSATASWSLAAGDGTKTVYVRVRDGAGNISVVGSISITLDTAAGTQFGFTINEGALPGTTRMKVSNDGGFAGAQWEPYNSHKPWTITQYGNDAIPRVVYVRYGDVSGNVLNTSQDDIILDMKPPKGNVSIADATSQSIAQMASNSDVLNLNTADLASNSVTLSLSATDDVSGVGGMILSSRADFYGAIWETYATTRQWTFSAGNTVYVRFKDNAGNISETYSCKGNQTIPIIQVTPISLNYGNVRVGSTKDLTLTVKNAGGGTLMGNATTEAPFSIVSGGNYNLLSDQSQVVTIRYQPTSPGTHMDAVVFTGGGGAIVSMIGKTSAGLPWLMLLLGN